MHKLLRVGVGSLLLAILGAGAWIALYHPPERRFQGKTAREWFEQCAQSVQDDGTIQDAAAISAVLHLGKQSVPCLVAALQRRKTAFGEDWNRMGNRLPAVATDVLPRGLDTREAWQNTWAAHEIVAAAPAELKRAVARAVVPSLLAEVRNPRVTSQ